MWTAIVNRRTGQGTRGGPREQSGTPTGGSTEAMLAFQVGVEKVGSLENTEGTDCDALEEKWGNPTLHSFSPRSYIVSRSNS